jgi:hypothetical protein
MPVSPVLCSLPIPRAGVAIGPKPTVIGAIGTCVWRVATMRTRRYGCFGSCQWSLQQSKA